MYDVIKLRPFISKSYNRFCFYLWDKSDKIMSILYISIQYFLYAFSLVIYILEQYELHIF